MIREPRLNLKMNIFNINTVLSEFTIKNQNKSDKCLRNFVENFDFEEEINYLSKKSTVQACHVTSTDKITIEAPKLMNTIITSNTEEFVKTVIKLKSLQMSTNALIDKVNKNLELKENTNCRTVLEHNNICVDSYKNSLLAPLPTKEFKILDECTNNVNTNSNSEVSKQTVTKTNTKYTPIQLIKSDLFFGKTLSDRNRINQYICPRKIKCGNSSVYTKRTRFRLLSGLGATSFFTLLTLVFLETILLSTVTNCAKTFYMHWNTSNSIFRIDNTDHIIDVNKGNLAFEFDQVHIICPVYEPGTFENETEKYIIYNVSKVEYETCRITNADPRVIAICDKPQKLMFFTITFRPFTPQPGGLEFLPGNDYYFISTSSKDDLYRRIGGRCSTNNMKVVFKVCCASEEKNKTANVTVTSLTGISGSTILNGEILPSIEDNMNIAQTQININQPIQHINSVNTIGLNTGSSISNFGVNVNNGIHLKPINSLNTNVEQYNRIPMQKIGEASNIMNNIGTNNEGNNNGMAGSDGLINAGVNLMPPGGVMGQYPGNHYPGQSGIRINNIGNQQHPSYKSNFNNNNDDHYDKLPNEVVKNEELTYNSAGRSIHSFGKWENDNILILSSLRSIINTQLCNTTAIIMENILAKFFNTLFNHEYLLQKILSINLFKINFNPNLILSLVLLYFVHFIFNYIIYLTSVPKCNPRNMEMKFGKTSYTIS